MRRRFPHLMRLLPLWFVLAAGATVLWVKGEPVTTPQPETNRDPEGRVARARERCEPLVRARFRQAGVAYPPRELFLRAFKRERELEVWAGDGGTLRVIHRLPFHASGLPGPKRREGDRQVPEGCYHIDAFNPISRFHLSLRVNYPNAADRLLSDREKPGFDIYLHGGHKSIGCLALGDEGIEEVFIMASDAANRDRIALHLFPARMEGAIWEKFVAPLRRRNPQLVQFWGQLQPVFDAFEHTQRVPDVAVEPDGAYRLRP